MALALSAPLFDDIEEALQRELDAVDEFSENGCSQDLGVPGSPLRSGEEFSYVADVNAWIDTVLETSVEENSPRASSELFAADSVRPSSSSKSHQTGDEEDSIQNQFGGGEESEVSGHEELLRMLLDRHEEAAASLLSQAIQTTQQVQRAAEEVGQGRVQLEQQEKTLSLQRSQQLKQSQADLLRDEAASKSWLRDAFTRCFKNCSRQRGDGDLPSDDANASVTSKEPPLPERLLVLVGDSSSSDIFNNSSEKSPSESHTVSEAFKTGETPPRAQSASASSPFLEEKGRPETFRGEEELPSDGASPSATSDVTLAGQKALPGEKGLAETDERSASRAEDCSTKLQTHTPGDSSELLSLLMLGTDEGRRQEEEAAAKETLRRYIYKAQQLEFDFRQRQLEREERNRLERKEREKHEEMINLQQKRFRTLQAQETALLQKKRKALYQQLGLDCQVLNAASTAAAAACAKEKMLQSRETFAKTCESGLEGVPSLREELPSSRVSSSERELVARPVDSRNQNFALNSEGSAQWSTSLQLRWQVLKTDWESLACDVASSEGQSQRRIAAQREALYERSQMFGEEMQSRLLAEAVQHRSNAEREEMLREERRVRRVSQALHSQTYEQPNMAREEDAAERRRFLEALEIQRRRLEEKRSDLHRRLAAFSSAKNRALLTASWGTLREVAFCRRKRRRQMQEAALRSSAASLIQQSWRRAQRRLALVKEVALRVERRRAERALEEHRRILLEKRRAAATRLQRVWRGRRTRREISQRISLLRLQSFAGRRNLAALVRLQAVIRGVLERKKLVALFGDSLVIDRRRKKKAATLIQVTLIPPLEAQTSPKVEPSERSSFPEALPSQAAFRGHRTRRLFRHSLFEARRLEEEVEAALSLVEEVERNLSPFSLPPLLLPPTLLLSAVAQEGASLPLRVLSQLELSQEQRAPKPFSEEDNLELERVLNELQKTATSAAAAPREASCPSQLQREEETSLRERESAKTRSDLPPTRDGAALPLLRDDDARAARLSKAPEEALKKESRVFSSETERRSSSLSEGCAEASVSASETPSSPSSIKPPSSSIKPPSPPAAAFAGASGSSVALGVSSNFFLSKRTSTKSVSAAPPLDPLPSCQTTEGRNAEPSDSALEARSLASKNNSCCSSVVEASITVQPSASEKNLSVLQPLSPSKSSTQEAKRSCIDEGKERPMEGGKELCEEGKELFEEGKERCEEGKERCEEEAVQNVRKEGETESAGERVYALLCQARKHRLQKDKLEAPSTETASLNDERGARETLLSKNQNLLLKERRSSGVLHGKRKETSETLKVGDGPVCSGLSPLSVQRISLRRAGRTESQRRLVRGDVPENQARLPWQSIREADPSEPKEISQKTLSLPKPPPPSAGADRFGDRLRHLEIFQRAFTSPDLRHASATRGLGGRAPSLPGLLHGIDARSQLSDNPTGFADRARGRGVKAQQPSTFGETKGAEEAFQEFPSRSGGWLGRRPQPKRPIDR